MVNKLILFYDGDCPLCSREIGWVRKTAADVEFIDIAASGFSAANYGLTQEALMAEIHAKLGDRTLIGMEVFRELYRRCGLGWLVAPTGWWPIRPIFDSLYRLFARNRLRLTGRCKERSC
jgi:predicted DCC family thiol-disulfide oxidoreductase YuxK